jgi:CheY-like chemotaxis protein
MMGGRAWAESEAGRGSTFYFTVRLEVQPAVTLAASDCFAETPLLNGSTDSRDFKDRSDTPSSAASEVASNQRAAMSVVSNGTLMRVLLVDDAADNRLLIKAFLKKSPFVIEEAENGAVAVTKFSEADYDVVLMDLQMPVVDGFEATRQMRELEAQRGAAPTPIIALTASALDTDVRRCLASGFTAHIAKPVKKALLLDTIRAAARRRSRGNLRRGGRIADYLFAAEAGCAGRSITGLRAKKPVGRIANSCHKVGRIGQSSATGE